MTWNAFGAVELVSLRGVWAVPAGVQLWCAYPSELRIYARIENDNGRPRG